MPILVIRMLDSFVASSNLTIDYIKNSSALKARPRDRICLEYIDVQTTRYGLYTQEVPLW